MNKKLFIQLAVVTGAIATGIFLGLRPRFIRQEEENLAKSSLEEGTEDENSGGIGFGDLASKEAEKPKSELANKDVINVLLLGIDRRSKAATTYNTDVMILASLNPEDNVMLLTSVPRDLWVNSNKINALYSVKGPETLIDAFEQVTGLEVDGYIRCDFEDFRWIVDSFGGVPVEVERSFTDTHFPNNTDTGLKPVSFEAGREVMDGWRALDFARSRKGTNGEGSDLMRAKRQHRILAGMVEGVSQPASDFWPMDIEKFYKAVTAAQRMYTTLKLEDVRYLWDFYKDREDYKVVSFVVDGKYVYHPGLYPNSEYHAWVFIPREPDFASLHEDIQEMLFPVEEAAGPAGEDTTQATSKTTEPNLVILSN
ncbi:hypothetical protein GF360_02515 [candidate division WWE3 bacterium]|nr:hypothetical protein [candidate division WWE3 bacterium]